MSKNSDLLKAIESYHYEEKSGLNYHNQFTFIVAVVLSAQARDEFINTQTPELFKNAPTAEKMYELGLENIAYLIRKIGLWRNKAKNIYALSKKIIELKEIKSNNQENLWYEEFLEKPYEDDDLILYEKPISNEGLPSFRSGLLLLPGVGRKSANVFLNVIYKAPVFPVDTHVIRLTSENRLNLAPGKNPKEIEDMLKESVPAIYSNKICHWLVWHGRKVCFARKPNCSECKLKNYCNFVKK